MLDDYPLQNLDGWHHHRVLAYHILAFGTVCVDVSMSFVDEPNLALLCGPGLRPGRAF